MVLLSRSRINCHSLVFRFSLPMVLKFTFFFFWSFRIAIFLNQKNLFIYLSTLVKKLLVKSGWNWLFIHKMPNVIPWSLKIFSISCLNLDFVAFSLLAKQCMKNMVKSGWKHVTFSAESINFFNREREHYTDECSCTINHIHLIRVIANDTALSYFVEHSN